MKQKPVACSFALRLPVYHLFDYELDVNDTITPGARFLLPFGQSQKTGILVKKINCSFERKLKKVDDRLDQQPLISEHIMALANWLAEYYCQPLGEVLFLCLPKYLRQPKVIPLTQIQYWYAADVDLAALHKLKHKAPRQYEILQALISTTTGMNVIQLRQLNESWRQPMKILENKGWVLQRWQECLPEITQTAQDGPQLTADQFKICQKMSAELNKFCVHLVQGVTGSGKTEVYLRQMLHVLDQGRQVIYLVPEIGLTPQLLQRLRIRLGRPIAVSHSGQSDFQRYQSWDQFKRGVVAVIVGTRSALFSQSPNLGLIIIDEEHDASYRQQDGVRYHARDVAVKRAQMLNIPVIMGSATPSIESLYNQHKPHFMLHRMDQRVNGSHPPDIELLDCSQVALQSGCSPQLIKAMKQHLDQKGQVLLYLNRRGFAPLVLCHECGWQADCHQCDARQTLHQGMRRLICHHCGSAQPLPVKCPSCGNSEIRHYGIGTEQLEDFLKQRFPDIDVIRVDRDSVSSTAQMEQKMQPVLDGVPCILIGTQMLAKGHDYPHITLVGILDADQALFSSFYRASERLIQTVLQVSGRAGRAEKKGRALLQTAFPSQELMQNLRTQSYSELLKPIIEERRLLGFPPYHRAVLFQVDAIDLAQAMDKLQKVRKTIKEINLTRPIKTIGPIPALMTRRVGRYRAQLSVLCEDVQVIRQLLKQLMPAIQNIKNTSKSRLTIEVDPLDL